MRAPVIGRRLREIRERLQLTLKAVETHSRRIAAEHRNPQYLFTAGRLSQIENSNSLPSIYKLASLSEIYHTPYLELLHWFEIDTGDNDFQLELAEDTRPEEAAANPSASRNP